MMMFIVTPVWLCPYPTPLLDTYNTYIMCHFLLYLQCLIQKSDYSAAISWLDRAKSTPVITVDVRM